MNARQSSWAFAADDRTDSSPAHNTILQFPPMYSPPLDDLLGPCSGSIVNRIADSQAWKSNSGRAWTAADASHRIMVYCLEMRQLQVHTKDQP